VLDADIDKRVAAELKKRGRNAISVYTAGLSKEKDPDLLPKLAAMFPEDDWVLFTADDRMPFEHANAVAASGHAIATVDPRRTEGYARTLEWRREIVHRWAHKIAEQEPRTWRRYGSRVTQWKARKRPQKFAAPPEGDV